ncbi:discoidin domain-containing protein [Neiella sp. HB171785]|uniref:Discoidin domain-containing protein n=1 Tax=Neiella litorisoli TaxID=2771431 RepID=A0A8J6UPY8_9GAMM|nr:discoidin domain-containing protein [Neiella litorisoli]MBD1389792.1 discoidin domain-containing protein [Neiella litorisoli]
MNDSKWVKQFIELHGFEYFRGKRSQQPLIVDVSENARFVKFELIGKESINLDKILIEDASGSDLRQGASIIVSSAYNDESRFDGNRLIVGPPTGGVNYHSKNEESPWLVIDLGAVKSIAKIRVYNRDDKFFYRALYSKISLSNDLSHWQPVFNNIAFLEHQDFNELDEPSKALVECATLRVTRARRYIDALVKQGQREEAEKLLAQCNEILREFDSSLGPHGLTQTFDVRTDEQKDLAYKELSKFLRLLNEEFGVSAFASSGTLLGFVRDQQLLGHDDDLDVCYISNKSDPDSIVAERAQLCEFLKQHGYQAKPSDVAHLWVYTGKGIMFDLFTGWREAGTTLMNPLPLPGVPDGCIDPIRKVNFFGYDIYLPLDPEPLLVLNYGAAWRTPDPFWKFDWSHAKNQYGFLYFGR